MVKLFYVFYNHYLLYVISKYIYLHAEFFYAVPNLL